MSIIVDIVQVHFMLAKERHERGKEPEGKVKGSKLRTLRLQWSHHLPESAPPVRALLVFAVAR